MQNMMMWKKNKEKGKTREKNYRNILVLIALSLNHEGKINKSMIALTTIGIYNDNGGVTKIQGEYFLQCAHPHCWIYMDWSMFLKLLLKYDNFDSNILLFQDPNKHLSSMALILRTTKD